MRIRNLYILILTVLLGSCQVDEYPSLQPYIFFADNIDQYVVDPAVDQSYIIKGSFNAESKIKSISIDSNVYTEKEIGAELNTYLFEHEVSLEDFTESRDVQFILEDKNGNITSKNFHFLQAKPIVTKTISLGAQDNPEKGFFYSLTDDKVYTVEEFINGQSNDDGFCFGYDTNNGDNMLVSPTALITENILSDFKGTQLISFSVVDIYNEETFTQIENNAPIRNLVGPSYRTFESTIVAVDKAYLFKMKSGKWGIIYVNDLVNGRAGSIELTVKLELE